MYSTFRQRPTHLRIDLNAIAHNYRWIQNQFPSVEIMPILKADAYGHGMLFVAKKLIQCGARHFGVAFLQEGIELRRAGIEAPILVLGGLVGYQVKHFLDYHLDLTSSSLFKSQQISNEAKRLGRIARVHLKIDTGMNRIGMKAKSALDFVQNTLQMENLEVIGLFSHFANAQGPDLDFAQKQLISFQQILKSLEKMNLEIPLKHMANSAALYTLPESIFSMIRPGLTLYGYPPSPELKGIWPIKPALSIHTEIVFFKGIRKDEGVGYDHTWRAPEDGWLATVPVGYGDGYPRILSNRAEVLIQGKRYPVVGNISMDQATIWLKKDKYDIGEKVILLGEQKGKEIDAWELAEKAESIAYEILCGWTPRVPRIFLGENA